MTILPAWFGSVDTVNALSVNVGFCTKLLKSMGDRWGEKLRTTGSCTWLAAGEPPQAVTSTMEAMAA